jgi:4'-phosphopantetheinyl transferase
MSVRIYSTEFKDPIPNDQLDALLAGLPVDIADKVRGYRRWQDACGCLFGKLLLKEALKEQGEAAGLHQLQYTGYGRPWLQNCRDFNISHSGQRVVCAIADTGGIGIDLEEIKHLHIEDFKDQFTPGEWNDITSAPHPLYTFYHFWTAKESIIKADGRGLHLPLAGISIQPDTPILLASRYWRLQPLTSFPDYACHVAAEHPADKLFLKEFPLTELIINHL